LLEERLEINKQIGKTITYLCLDLGRMLTIGFRE
jgi:hypothetical protein